jgi:hypothetical protein
LLSVIIAIAIPDHAGQRVITYICGLTTAHWKVSSWDVSNLKISNSIVDSYTVIIAVHSSSESVVKPLVLKTPPAVHPKPIASYLWEPDLGRMANLKLVDKRGKELVKLKLQVFA